MTYTAADASHIEKGSTTSTIDSIAYSKLYLAAYTYGNTTFIEGLLKRQDTTVEYSEIYTPNPLANVKQINHSVMAMVLNKITDRPIQVFYSLTGLDNKNIAVKEGIYYTAIPLEENPVQKRLKNAIREAQL